MKKILFFCFVSSCLFLFVSCLQTSNFVKTDRALDDIVITDNSMYASGRTELGYLKVSSKPSLFSSKSKNEMYQAALIQVRKKAKKIGARVIVVQNVSYSWDFLQCTIEGIAYR